MIGERKQHLENTNYCLLWSKLPFFTEQCSTLRNTYRLPRWHSGKESTHQCRRWGRYNFNPWVRKIPWRRKWRPTLVFLPREFHGQRSLAGYSPWGRKESDVTEQLSTHKQPELAQTPQGEDPIQQDWCLFQMPIWSSRFPGYPQLLQIRGSYCPFLGFYNLLRSSQPQENSLSITNLL